MEENNRMARRFEQLLGAPVKVKMKLKQAKLYPRIILSSNATNKFIEIVRPFIHPTMEYKVEQNIAHHLNQRICKKLIKEYGKKPTKVIAKETGLTLSETYVIAYRLGLTKKNRIYTIS